MQQIDTSQHTTTGDSTVQARQSVSQQTAQPAATDTHVQAPAAVTVRQTHATVYNTVVPATLLRPADTVADVTADDTDYLMLCNDSLFAPYKNQTIQYRESMFAGNSRSTAEPRPVMHHNGLGSDWIFGIIILLFALTSLYLNRQKFRLRDIFMSLFGHRVQERVFRESNLKPRTLLPMTGIYLAALSLVALRATQQWHVYIPHTGPFTFYILILVALMAFILARTLLARILGDIFNDTSSINTYIASNYLFHFVGALVLLPLALLLYYCPGASQALLQGSLIFIVILFIIRLLRGMQLILTNSKNSKLHLFYYLCILEIVPILVIIKVIIL